MARNCLNKAGLSEGARAVEGYSGPVREEILRKGACKVFTLGTLRLYECPLSYLTDETIEVMRAVYLMDGSGHLLYGGGWAEQPAWLVEAYEMFRCETALRRREEDDA